MKTKRESYADAKGEVEAARRALADLDDALKRVRASMPVGSGQALIVEPRQVILLGAHVLPKMPLSLARIQRAVSLDGMTTTTEVNGRTAAWARRQMMKAAAEHLAQLERFIPEGQRPPEWMPFPRTGPYRMKEAE